MIPRYIFSTALVNLPRWRLTYDMHLPLYLHYYPIFPDLSCQKFQGMKVIIFVSFLDFCSLTFYLLLSSFLSASYHSSSVLYLIPLSLYHVPSPSKHFSCNKTWFQSCIQWLSTLPLLKFLLTQVPRYASCKLEVHYPQSLVVNTWNKGNKDGKTKPWCILFFARQKASSLVQFCLPQ